jgi:5-methylcytosine-specific restriction protein A
MIVHECRKPGCHALISATTCYCSKHVNNTSRTYDYIRMHRKLTRTYRLFYQSKAWKQLRKLKLSKQPLCERCMKQGKYTLATDVHHVKPVFDYPDEKLKIENLQSLCKPCHEQIHKDGYYPPL